MKLNKNFPHASKYCKKGLSFYIPKYMHKLFEKYKKQLADHGRFLRNGSVRKEMHEQNMGINCPRTKFFRLIEANLGLTEKSLTAHVGRRSGAISLADAGISMPNLKEAGRWASTLADEEYMGHIHASKKERLTLLDTKEGKQHQERNKTALQGAVPKKLKKLTTIIY
eukprot:9728572-Ditylum_brightwellii.AAC.1